MAETGYAAARKTYLSLSDEFTELNKEYNRAIRAESLDDDLELRFLKAERALHDAYREQQNAKMAELPESGSKGHGNAYGKDKH